MKILWRPGLTLTVDPDASDIYQWDWTDWLGARRWSIRR